MGPPPRRGRGRGPPRRFFRRNPYRGGFQQPPPPRRPNAEYQVNPLVSRLSSIKKLIH